MVAWWRFVVQSSCLWEDHQEALERGRGGNLYLEGDGEMNSLLPFRNCVHYRVGDERMDRGE